MTFLAAGWLLLFVPLAAVAWIVSRRVTRPAETTASWLWTDERNRTERPAGRRAMPPRWMIAALAAAAMAIVALAGPAGSARPRVTVIVDPSARLASDLPAMWSRVADVAGEVVVPGQAATSIDAIRPTARDMRDPLLATIARRSQPAIVLTDEIDLPSHVLAIRPPARSPIARIARLAARDVDGTTHVLVRLERDEGSAGTGPLVLRSGDERTVQSVDWPLGARALDLTVRVKAGDRVEATLDGATARLARDARADIRIATRGELSDAARRFAAVYARERPSDAARTVTLSGDDGASDGPRVRLARGPATPTDDVARRVEHPAIDGVPAAAFDALPISVELPAGFTPVAWRGDRPTVAVRDGPDARSVWIALDAARPTPAWVSLLDAAVRWVAGGGDAWSASTPDDVPASGWTPVEVEDATVEASPGWYRDADGRPRAVNAAPSVAALADGSPSDQSLADFIARHSSRRVAPATSAAAWVAATLAALTAALCRLDGWRGRI